MVALRLRSDSGSVQPATKRADDADRGRFSLEAGEQLRRDALGDFTARTGIGIDLIPAWGSSEGQLSEASHLLSRRSNPPDVFVLDVVWAGTLAADLLDLRPYVGSRRTGSQPDKTAPHRQLLAFSRKQMLGDWILSRGSGLFLTSPDGKVDRKISDRIYMLQGWAHDGSLIYGIRATESHHLVPESINPETARKPHHRLWSRSSLDAIWGAERHHLIPWFQYEPVSTRACTRGGRLPHERNESVVWILVLVARRSESVVWLISGAPPTSERSDRL
jgi:hypothetical protein